MDHKAIIAALEPEQRHRLLEKSDVAGLGYLAVHAGAIGLLAWAIVEQVPYWQLLLIPQGILIVFLFTLLHETCHRTPFKSLWINESVAKICGFLLALPPEWFRYFHFAHHRYTQDPEKDPELASPKPKTLTAYLWQMGGLPVWVFHVRQIFTNLKPVSQDSFVPPSAYSSIRREAAVMIVCYTAVAAASAYFQTTAALFAWVVPAIIGQPFLRLYLLAEHGLCPEVPDMLQNSRTLKSNWLVRRIAWNMPYHIEHHASPTVPFYRLPELHALIRQHTREPEAGYLAFHRAYVARLVS